MFLNTENHDQTTTFFNGILKSLPSYHGLWFPKEIPQMDPEFFNELPNLEFHELANQVLSKLLNKNDLKQVVKKAYNFPVVVKELSEELHVLETFHGPTLTFKDFGARFMAFYLESKLKRYNQNYHILVSTSGDTGSAIASAFYNKSNLRVTILYPENRISSIQELQMTTFDNNITSYGLDTSFDKCQTLVKKSFADTQLNQFTNIMSANSINLARLLPQCLYYFYSYGQLVKKYGDKVKNKVVFTVPSGNCGNLVGGLIAKQMGLPIKRFIVGQNDNDTFVRFLNENEYLSKDTIKTISNAMDVGDPSNYKRVFHMYKDNLDKLKQDVKGLKISEEETLQGIKEVYTKYNYVIDPHTSVGYQAYQKLKQEDEYNIIVSTASPVKFYEIVEKELNIKLEKNETLEDLRLKPKTKILIKPSYDFFKSNLVSRKQKRSFTFIGMPGSGKSTISKLLSTKLNIKLLELDDHIENEHNMTLFELIEKYGEEGFKLIEEQGMMSINFLEPVIVSTGGSVIYSDIGMSSLQRNSEIIYLNTDFNKIMKRTENLSNRGIVFNGKTPKELYLERHQLYSKYCHYEIKTNNLSEEEMIKIIRDNIF